MKRFYRVLNRLPVVFGSKVSHGSRNASQTKRLTKS
jgi:hypothetical protein